MALFSISGKSNRGECIIFCMARIVVGDYAPEFTFDSVNMGTVSLSDYRGKRVLLVFGRYFGCPACQLDFDELLEYKDRVMENAEIVFFTQSTPESASSYITEYEVDFPVIPVSGDEGYKVYKDYSVGNLGIGSTIEILRKAGKARKLGKVHGAYEGRETQSPADFVIDGEGKVIWAHKGVFNPEKLLDFLESL